MGLVNRLDRCKYLTHTGIQSYTIDILLVSETHFTSKSHFTIPGYDLCSTNHPDGTAHGGTAIIVKSTIAYHTQLKHEEAEIQATSIKVNETLRDITIAAVYCPPRHNLKAPHFETFFPNARAELLGRW